MFDDTRACDPPYHTCHHGTCNCTSLRSIMVWYCLDEVVEEEELPPPKFTPPVQTLQQQLKRIYTPTNKRNMTIRNCRRMP
jgi:hypothetical protein